MYRHAGFTLIETLITTLVLATGLTAVAAVFTYGVQSDARLRQRTAALVLLYNKMEELRMTTQLSPGRYTETVSMPTGVGETYYLRTWEVSSDIPRKVTVILYGKQPRGNGAYWELARGTALIGPRF